MLDLCERVMAGFQMVGVMAMVCWLAEIVAVTGAPKGAVPQESSGSDSEARDEAPVGSSASVPDSGVEASVPDSGVAPVEEPSPAGSDALAEQILRRSEDDAKRDEEAERAELERMQEEEHQRSLREQRRQRIHREQAEAEQRSRQRWEEMREAQLREQVRAEVDKEAEERIHSGIEAGVWDRISQAHAQGSGLPLLLQLLVNMGQILTQLTQDRADTKEFFLSQVRHQSHQLAELQQAHSRMIGQLTQLLQNQLARDLGRAPPAAPASPRPLAAPASPRPPAALASPRPPAAAASPRAPAAPASPRLAAPSTAGPSSGTPAGFGGAATPQAMKRLPKDTTGKILRCGACHGCFTVETNPKSRAHCVQWRQELQELADEAKAEESEEKEQKKSKKRKKKDKKLMVEEPDRVSLPDRDRDGDKDKGPDGDGSAQGSALKKSRLVGGRLVFA